ncbi:Abi-alpha family protein [[Mycobacterium] zoologicum]|uniref:Abi-alpha family protein n=1 Tax=[Mycobacterium] zoologicum TaxID=2872311 RepID=UPI001CDA8BD6|nr:Abi-alpha family protein [Mycolicibacter sp. MYC101]MEB3064477.1 Abi-alpha family protein [Mycolicibacter sp. MYC101]
MGDKRKKRRDQAGGAPLPLLDVLNRLADAVPAPIENRGKGKSGKARKSKRAEQPAAPIPVVNELVSRLGLPLGNDALGGLANTAITPVVDTVGHGLRQAGELANTPPLRDVTDVLARVISGGGPAEAAEALRNRGTALVRVSYKPEFQRRDVHPSFSRIIDELVPDEARILRFLKVAGTQPMIDVRTKTWFQIGSELVTSGISMIARMAGCLWPDRDQHYFANLDRLGLVAISNEPVDDYRRYALLEVQHPAVEAIESVPKAVTIYRSVRLTAFGEQFVDVCIDCDGYTAGGWDTDGRQDRIKGKRR